MKRKKSVERTKTFEEADTNIDADSPAPSESSFQKKLFKQVFLCGISLLLIVCSLVTLYDSVAWFSANDKVKGEGIHIGVVSPDSISITVYEWKEDADGRETWVELSKEKGIDFDLLLPNQSNRFLITSGTLLAPRTPGNDTDAFVLKEGSETGDFDLVRFVLDDAENSRPTDIHSGAVNGEDNPYSYLYARTQTFTGNAAGEGAFLGYDDTQGSGALKSFYDINAAGNTYDFAVAGEAPLATQVIDIYFSKELCKHFSSWGFTGIITVDKKKTTEGK